MIHTSSFPQVVEPSLAAIGRGGNPEHRHMLARASALRREAACRAVVQLTRMKYIGSWCSANEHESTLLPRAHALDSRLRGNDEGDGNDGWGVNSEQELFSILLIHGAPGPPTVMLTELSRSDHDVVLP